jgi:hypothetical protein
MGDERTEDFRAHRRQTLGLPVRDDRTRMIGLTASRAREQQKQHLDSVSSRIGGVILEFCKRNVGQEFHADVLRHYVELHCGRVAPGSPDRILRCLRARGQVSYTVLNRGQSLYRIDHMGDV